MGLWPFRKLGHALRGSAEMWNVLLALTNAGIADLRHYTGDSGRRDADQWAAPRRLLAAVQRFTKKLLSDRYRRARGGRDDAAGA